MSMTYRPGQLIYSGVPFAQVVYDDHRKTTCDYCFEIAGRLKSCASCKYVYYCNKTCQTKAWAQHKGECPHLKNLGNTKSDFVRLIGKVILKLKGKKWSEFEETVGNLKRSFKDLISHVDIKKNNPKLSLHGIEILHLLKNYLGEKKLPSDDEVLEVIGKVKYNRFSVCGVGSALYIGGSVFDHSCIPNAARNFKKNVLEVRATTYIPKGDIRKVTISYVPVLTGLNQWEETKQCFYSDCLCVDCSTPYGDSVLTKIVEKTKAWSVIELSSEVVKKLETVVLAGGFYLPANQMLELKKLLKMQERVLGDTNILHLKLLAMNGYLNMDVREKTRAFRKLADLIEKAFGRNSEELIWVYEVLVETCFCSNDLFSFSFYLNKLAALNRLLKGN